MRPTRGAESGAEPTILEWTRRLFVVAVLAGVVAAGVTPFVAVAGAQSGGQADIVFVFDRTGSMSDERDALKAEISSVSQSLQDDGVDARYALIAYEGNSASETQLIQDFTSDVSTLNSALDFTFFGGEENASHAILEATELNYRNDATRIVIVFTDEDDDGTTASREAALQAIEDTETVLIAVSPNSDSSNELKTMANSAGGRWVNINGGDFAAVLEEVVDAIQAVTERSTAGRRGPSYEVTGTLNRTEVEVGEPIALTVNITNDGGRDGRFAYVLTADGRIVNQSNERIRVDRDETVTIEETLTFNQRGGYYLLVSSRYVGRLVVTELRETNTTVDFRNADPGSNGLVVVLRDIRPGQPTSVELPTLRSGFDQGVIFDEVTLTTNRTVRNMTLDLTQTSSQPDGVPNRPDDGVRPFLSWLDVTVGGADPADVENVSMVVRVRTPKLEGLPPENLALYRYTGSGDWTLLEATYTGEADGYYRYEVDAPGFSTYAVGVRDGQFEVVSTSLSDETAAVGQSVQVGAVVENTGGFDADYRAVLSANDAFVNDTVVTIPAGETRSVSFTVAFDAPGDYQLAINETGAGTLTVESAATPTPTPTEAPTETPESEPTASPEPEPEPTETDEAEETPATTESGGQPGFALVTALLALLAAALLATRRRD